MGHTVSSESTSKSSSLKKKNSKVVYLGFTSLELVRMRENSSNKSTDMKLILPQRRRKVFNNKFSRKKCSSIPLFRNFCRYHSTFGNVFISKLI